MKVIICGSREFTNPAQIEQAIRLSGFTITEVVTGGGTGVDYQANELADRMDLDRVQFHANWRRHGRAAGPLRNARMVAYADACIALPGGRGTADCVRRAKAVGLKVYVVGE